MQMITVKRKDWPNRICDALGEGPSVQYIASCHSHRIHFCFDKYAMRAVEREQPFNLSTAFLEGRFMYEMLQEMRVQQLNKSMFT